MKRVALVLALVLSCNPEVTELADVSAPPVIDFAKDIRPLIRSRCAKCHYPGEQLQTGVLEGGLDVSNLASIRRGGFHTGYGIIVPGNPAASALVRKLRGTFEGGERMPKDGPPYLSEEQIRVVELWIEQGAEGEPDE